MATASGGLNRGAFTFDNAMLAACALLPAALGAAGAASAAPASHDEAVVRVVGLGWTGLFRGLDVIVAAPLMLAPIGTRAMRAGLASAVVAGACGALAFWIARQLVEVVRPGAAKAAPRLMAAVAAVAALSGVMAPVWQVEAAAPGGAVVGALIVLAAIALGAEAQAEADAQADANADADAKANAGAIAFVLGLAASYEPIVRVAALVAVAPWMWGKARAITGAGWIHAAIAFAMGLAPLALSAALGRRAPEIAIAGARPFASSIGTHAHGHVPIAAFAQSEIGMLLLVAAAAGAVLAWLVPDARRCLASLVGVILVGVVAISNARVPFAQASAALVVVLELVLPVRAADETLTRREARASQASTVWNEVAWGAAPPAAVLLVSEPSTMRRIAAARATGQMRPDLLVIPTFAMPSRATDRALASEPKLAPLYRDVALGSTPEELSLATLATQRPLLASFDPHWDRGLARHFVPVGLTTAFEPEPRGSSDRRRGLDAFTASKERLVRVAVAKKDPDLAAATATLLRGRAIGMAACGERDVLSRALDDLRPFAPEDPVANTLVRRIVTSKGPIDVRDLVP